MLIRLPRRSKRRRVSIRGFSSLCPTVLSSRRWPRVWGWARPWRDSWCRSRCRCCGGSRSWRWTGLRAVSTATVQVTPIRSTPNDHFIASPYCGVVSTTNRCIGRAGRCPTVCSRIVPGTGICEGAVVPTPKLSSRCQSTLPCERFGE